MDVLFVFCIFNRIKEVITFYRQCNGWMDGWNRGSGLCDRGVPFYAPQWARAYPLANRRLALGIYLMALWSCRWQAISYKFFPILHHFLALCTVRTCTAVLIANKSSLARI